MLKRYKTFLDMLKSQPENNVAFLYEKNEKIISMTYKDTIEAINNYPLEEGNSIGILAENNLETILAIFSYANLKKQIVLLNPLDDVSLLQKQIDSTNVDCLIGRKELVNLLKINPSEKLERSEDNILFFTSGTTANNKAVVLTQESLCNSAYNGGCCLPLKEEDTLLSILPLSHVFGFVCSLLWALSFGAKVALGRGLRHILDDGEYFHASVVSLVPQIATFMAMNNIFNKELRLVLIGAGPINQVTINLIKENNIQVSFGYGLTETSSGVALSIGDDPFAMKICPDDKIEIANDGEILISSPTCMMKGYYQDEESTNEVLYNGCLHTGDLGQIDENGLLHITGRKKDILVLGDGTKIFCPQYEEELRPYLANLDYAINLINEKVALFVYDDKHQINIEDKIKEFNINKQRGQRISTIKYVSSPLERTQTGKIKRWALKNMKEVEK